MCTTCGCGSGEARIEGKAGHVRADGSVHSHSHAHDAEQGQGAGAQWRRRHLFDRMAGARAGAATGPLGAVHVAGTPAARIVAVERDILARNDSIAGENRRRFADRGLFVLNLVSSPGSGKTSLLVRTIVALRGRVPVAVIEGDQQTARDADRIRETGAPAIQVNTGKGCHLDAAMVGRAFAGLPPIRDGVLFIENVGNLVCPAAFDLGEAHKVAILSVTEGEDKPLKYPDMFHAADMMLINKIDLSPYVDFDAAAAAEFARRVRPGLPVLMVSATTGEGLDAWVEWLLQGAASAKSANDCNVDPQRRPIGEHEPALAKHSRTGSPA